MKNFIIKRFYKNSCVRAILFQPDKRVAIHYLIPDNHDIVIGDKRFIVNDKDFLILKGIQTYIYVFDSIEPINPYNLNKSAYTPDYYETAINSKAIKELFESMEPTLPLQVILFILIGVTVAGFGLLYYTISDQLSFLITELTELIEKLRSGGVID